MRHVIAALAVIVVSLGLALQWMPAAQAGKKVDPGAALRKNAAKDTSRVLKPVAREIRARGRATATRLKILAKAVRKGSPVPGAVQGPAKGTSELSAADARKALGDAARFLADDEFARALLLRQAIIEARKGPNIADWLSSNTTVRDRMRGAGGLVDQVTQTLEDACDDADQAVAVGVSVLLDALVEKGFDATAAVFPVRGIRPLTVDTNATVPLMFPSFSHVVAFENRFNGTVRLPIPTTNSTSAFRIDCVTPAGTVVGTCPVVVGQDGDLGSFSCPAPGSGTYLLRLFCDDQDAGDCCPPAAESWLGMLGPPAGGSGGGVFRLRDITSTSAQLTVDGQPGPDAELSMALVRSLRSNEFAGFDLLFVDPSSGKPMFGITLTYDPATSENTRSSLVTFPLGDGANPTGSVFYVPPLTPELRFDTDTVPTPVAGKVEERFTVEYDRDVATYVAGRPTFRVLGSATVRAENGDSHEIAFDVRIHYLDVERP